VRRLAAAAAMTAGVLGVLGVLAATTAVPADGQPAPALTLDGDVRCDGSTGVHMIVWQLTNGGGDEVTVTAATLGGLASGPTVFLPDRVAAGGTARSQTLVTATGGGTVTMTITAGGIGVAAEVTVPAGPCVPDITQELSGTVSCLPTGDRLVTWTTANPASGAPVLSFAGRTRGLVVGDIRFEPDAVPIGGTATARTVVPAAAGSGLVILTVSFSTRETGLAFVEVAAAPCPAAPVPGSPTYTG
jgi:hypothetical protein